MKSIKRFLFFLLVALGAFLALSVGAFAIGDSTLFASTPYVGFVASPGKTYELDINIENKGNSIREVALGLEQLPEGYKAYFDTNGRIVTDIFLKPESAVFTKLVVVIPKDRPEGEDVITATFSEAGSVQKISYKLKIESKSLSEGEGRLTVQFPELTGTPDTAFSFKATYNNETSNSQAFSLASKAPEGWVIGFKPMYEDKNIASISVDAGGAQVLDVSVKPPANVAAGTYVVSIALVSADEVYTADLTTVIIGTYEAALTTQDGRLNFDAVAGKSAVFPLQIVNTGSASLQEVKLSFTCPPDWVVSFDRDTIEEIKEGETCQVLMSVKPPSRAIAGEYMVTAVASNVGIKVSTDLRVMVKTPAWWGLIGIFVIALILILLLYLFKKYGRR